jgi:hypothetical protein
MSGPAIIPGCDVLPAMGRPTRGTARSGKSFKGSKQRWATLNSFVDFTLQHLTGAERDVWLVLYRDTKDGVARTAQTDIGRRADLNVRTVRRAVARLQRRGLLTVVYRGSLRRGPSSYRVHALIHDDELDRRPGA